MSFWGKLFGSDDAVGKIIDNVSSGLDKLHYGSQEKAEDDAADRSEARKMVIEWLKNTQGQNLARRLIALMVTGVWLLQYLAALFLNVAAVWATDPGKLQKSADLVAASADQMNGAVMMVLAFYFAAPHMGKVVEAAMNKFSGSKVK